MLKLLDLWKRSHDDCLSLQIGGLSGPGSLCLCHIPCFSFKYRELWSFSCWIVYSSARLRSLLNTTTTLAACDFQLKTDFQGCQSLKNYLFWGIFLKQPWWCLVQRWILHSRIEQNRAGSESFQSWIQAESNPATTDFIALTDHIFYLEVRETTDFWWRVLRSLSVDDPN